MRVSREQAAQNRERIVETASRLFREKGYDGIGVADLMKSAGLTHGGFYGHFASKEDLLAEAFGKAMEGSAETWRKLLADGPANPRGALAHMYLTSRHRDNPGKGCALAALGPDVSRVGPEVRQAMADSFQAQVSALAAALPGTPEQQRRDAITTYAAMVGGLVLARAVADRKQSDEILAAVLATLEQGQLMLAWLRQYRRALLPGDISAGIVVAMMMIPQGMAYALVAGLPPVTGIYASILPPIIYALFGTSMTQSVGPMAIVSLMTAAIVGQLAPAGSALYSVLAAQLALVAGAMLLLCGLLRLGFLANFFSRPVMSGFTVGSALVIAWGQVKPLLGADWPHWHAPSAALGLGALLLLVLARSQLAPLLRACGMRPAGADMAARLAPMLVVLLGLLLVQLLGLEALGVQTTGQVPTGLPQWNLATSPGHWQQLLQPGMLVGFVVFLISMSAAQSLALKRNEKLASNRELVGLGAANVASMVSGAFPVTGSMSRSAVNFAAGAQTPLASIITACLLALALVAPTGWLALLPMPVLAATIIVAVLGMLELDTLRTAWRYDRGDALAWFVTGAGVVLLGVEAGVLVGVALSMGTLIWRASRPHIAVLGRIAGSEHFRNIERYPAETRPELLVLRIDANLFFGNVEAVQQRIEDELRTHPTARNLVLAMSAVSSIDTTALFALGELNASLVRRGIGLHLAEVKGPVMDRLRDSDLPQRLNGQIFLSTAIACDTLAG